MLRVSRLSFPSVVLSIAIFGCSGDDKQREPNDGGQHSHDASSGTESLKERDSDADTDSDSDSDTDMDGECPFICVPGYLDCLPGIVHIDMPCANPAEYCCEQGSML
jgi:hypothetical protein